jgi:hypothetical protein
MRLDEARLRIAYKESQELSATVTRECDEAEEVFLEGDERVGAQRREVEEAKERTEAGARRGEAPDGTRLQAEPQQTPGTP